MSSKIHGTIYETTLHFITTVVRISSLISHCLILLTLHAKENSSCSTKHVNLVTQEQVSNRRNLSPNAVLTENGFQILTFLPVYLVELSY
jgi:hypothetical protein